MTYAVFITGVSTTGKTTLYERLKSEGAFTQLTYHDIDEVGVPPVGLGPWREYRTQHVLFDANESAKNGDSTIICGIVFPHEIIESPYYDPETCRAIFIAITAQQSSIEERFKQRQKALQEEGGFHESLSEDNLAETLRLSKQNQKVLINAVSSLKEGYIVDSTDLDAEAVYQQVTAILEQHLERSS